MEYEKITDLGIKQMWFCIFCNVGIIIRSRAIQSAADNGARLSF